MPRILVSGKTTVLDNVKRVMLLTDEEIIVFNGKKYTSVRGHDFLVESLMDERMLITGEVEEVRFFRALQEDKAGRK